MNIKCPHCGSTAQTKKTREVTKGDNIFHMYYTCGCGAHFVLQCEIFNIYTETINSEKSMRTKKIYCPVNGWDCPYYHYGECGIEDPIHECEDFAIQWDEDDDYICEDEERTAFE